MENNKNPVSIFEDAFRRKINTPTRDEEEEEKLRAKKAALEQLQQNLPSQAFVTKS